MAKWLDVLFNDYLQEELEEGIKPSSSPVVIGGIYFGSLKYLDEDKPNKPLYFLIVDKIDKDLYEVLKMSDWSVFARNTDVILDIGTMKVMIETDNNFYLKGDEINKFVLVHKLSEQDVQDILLFRDGEEPSRPLRIGVTPIYDEDVRNKYNKEEFNQIKDYHMRIFEILAMPEEEAVFDDISVEDSEEWVEPIEERWLYPLSLP